MKSAKNKTLFILAGANGSGKSTIAKELLPEENIVYVNADDIARELCPEDMQSVRIQAGKKLHARLNQLFTEGKSFALESTLSGVGHIKTIQTAHRLGYDVVIVYTFVDSADSYMVRIQTRVKNGGHPVPKEDVIRRFNRSKQNFWNIYKALADYWVLYYNGGDDIVPVAQQDKGQTVAIFTENLYTMFTRDL
ncbi:MAG: zeta toxin family protein [Elusimicrobiaceae bacterium]|nr:zeta toxin family protein [Elusimicrobiaceae bacterium]